MKPLSGAWLKPWAFQETDPEFRTWYFPVRIFTMVTLFVSISGILRLSPESYQKRVIYLAFLEKILMNWQWLMLSITIFAPYDYQFTLSKFSYLSHRPSLQITWGPCKMPTWPSPRALPAEFTAGALIRSRARGNTLR